jgi:precorrin-2 methylase
MANSDLELAGKLCHQDVVAHIADCRERTLATLCDNTPAVAWIKMGSVSNYSSAAYLLGLLALYQRHHRYLTEVSHIPGVFNTMAHDA